VEALGTWWRTLDDWHLFLRVCRVSGVGRIKALPPAEPPEPGHECTAAFCCRPDQLVAIWNRASRAVKSTSKVSVAPELLRPKR